MLILKDGTDKNKGNNGGQGGGGDNNQTQKPTPKAYVNILNNIFYNKVEIFSPQNHKSKMCSKSPSSMCKQAIQF